MVLTFEIMDLEDQSLNCVVFTSSLWMKPWCVTIHMKDFEGHFHVPSFIVPCKIVLTL